VDEGKAMIHWFTADWHLYHENVIRYCNRPFDSVEEMDQTIIQRFNDRVGPGDMVYFLGDFCFKPPKSVEVWDIIDHLNGRIVFIKGNHDTRNTLNTRITALELNLSNTSMYLVHDPAHANPNYYINIVGHIHQRWRFKRWEPAPHEVGYLINVGVDVWDFYPVSFNEMITKFEKWKRTGK